MRNITTSIYNFPDFVAGNYLYVDKTEHLYRLVGEYKNQCFIARPRRFGKSLMISTLKCIFQGRRDLFRGLAIDQTDYNWKTYPVIHLDMGSTATDNLEETRSILWEMIDDISHKNDVKLTKKFLITRFQQLIEEMAADKPVVILIDEYDKTLLGHIGRDSVAGVQDLLKSFYSVIKTTESSQRFVMITGVSKFSKVSIFSDLNNLSDLTMHRDFATLLGYTQQELEDNFGGYIARLAEDRGMSVGKALDELREWYNGYRFHPMAETVYNPVSVMKCFQEREFQNYWFETGTPSFLLRLLKQNPLDTNDLSLPATAFSTYDPAELNSLALLYQTGYLTILRDHYAMGMQYYDLDYPNREIQQSFSYWLTQKMSEVQEPELSRTFQGIALALENGDIDEMLEHLKVFFAGIPNDITLKHEKYYQSLFFAVFKFIGAMVESEVSTNKGRIDAVVKTEKEIFIFEFKLHGSAEEALEQIREKGYAVQYGDDPRPCRCVGVEFDPNARNISKWVISN